MDTPLMANAFRVLSLPADADSKEIYRQQQRLQNALELGDPTAATFYKFLPDLTLGPELLLVAIHRLERQRLLEELFWIHDLGSEFDLKSKTADTVLVELRAKLDQNTRQGAVAQHNLAVMLTFLARELSGLRRFEYWAEALSHWQQTLDGDNFWRFMSDRIETIPGASGTTVEDLRNQVKNVLQAAIADEMWSAIENKDYAAIRLATELVLVHQGLLDREVTLKAIAEKLVNDGFVAIGGVFDRVAGIAKAGDPFIIRNALTASEHEILRISNAFSETFKALGPAVASAGWDDARAKAYEQLSVAYFNLLHDAPAALRLLVEGQKLAHDVELKTRLGDGWKHVQRDVLCAEGLELARAGYTTSAEQKFAGALSLSTPEQKPEVEQLLENCGARVSLIIFLPATNPGVSSNKATSRVMPSWNSMPSGSSTSTPLLASTSSIFSTLLPSTRCLRLSRNSGSSFLIRQHSSASSLMESGSSEVGACPRASDASFFLSSFFFSRFFIGSNGSATRKR